jgi:hypothetical protein
LNGAGSSITPGNARTNLPLILAVAESAGMAPLATFDERLGKLPGTRKLGRKRKQR